MKKLLIFVTLVFAISCKQACGDDEYIPADVKKCHELDTEDNNKYYCCYYEGYNLDSNKDEKY